MSRSQGGNLYTILMDLFQLVFILNLAILALDHLVSGALGVFFPVSASKFFKIIFGANISFTAEHLLIFKPWGALGIFAGLVGILPIFDPQRYEAILWMLVVLLVLRITVRSTNMGGIETYLNISQKRNALHSALIMLCASLIVFEIVTL